jgi:hypothetical protein
LQAVVIKLEKFYPGNKGVDGIGEITFYKVTAETHGTGYKRIASIIVAIFFFIRTLW